MKLVTHNSRFHADDVFASATLLLRYPGSKIIRSRDQKIIDDADIVYDVGNIYDPEQLRFDHHQKGGAGHRDNGIPYASFGLVWRHFGEEIAGSREVAERIDRKLVQPIDAMDNGMDILTPKMAGLYPYTFQTVTFSFGPTWKEAESQIDKNFFDLVAFAERILDREIVQAKDLVEGEKFVKAAYEKAADRRVIELDANYPWDEFLSTKPEPLYVIRPVSQSPNWQVEAVRDDIHSYAMRKELPENWAGKRDDDFAATSGVPDAHFCHNGRFMAVARSREGALKLAELSLEN
jgi:uncharacterized UPF0160 family protein